MSHASSCTAPTRLQKDRGRRGRTGGRRCRYTAHCALCGARWSTRGDAVQAARLFTKQPRWPGAQQSTQQLALLQLPPASKNIGTRSNSFRICKHAPVSFIVSRTTLPFSSSTTMTCGGRRMGRKARQVGVSGSAGISLRESGMPHYGPTTRCAQLIWAHLPCHAQQTAAANQLTSSGLAMRAIISARSWLSVLAYRALRATPVPPGAVCAAPPNENCSKGRWVPDQWRLRG